MGDHLGTPGAADMGSFINACLEGSEKCQIHPHLWKGSKASQSNTNWEQKITHGAETAL